VRQVSDSDEQEQKQETANSVEPTAASVSTMATSDVKQDKSRAARGAKQSGRASKSSAAGEVKQDESASSETSTVPKGSAAARLAERRHVVHKAQQRAAASLITSEHYAYVRRDLVYIAILAAIMFSAIIILHFVPGIGS
jgi:hypothetical protein